jgi:hypothetical protein
VSAEPPKPLDPLDPEVTPDASSRIAIDPAVRTRPKSKSWSALLRESWHGTAPATPEAPATPVPASSDPAKPR